MPNFDLARTYQAALFFGQEPRLPEDLAQRLSANVPNTEGLGLKLRPSKPGVLALLPVGPALTCESSSGLWTATMTAERLDVHFKALGFEEIAGKRVGAVEMVARLVPNLAALAHEQEWTINRAAIVATAEASGTGEPATAAQRVAREFFNDRVVDAVTSGEVPDLMARVNIRERWKLPMAGDPDVVVNCIRTATGATGPHAQGGNRLTWQLDVNTAPGLLPEPLRGEALRVFFQHAAEWVERALTTAGEGLQ